MGTLAPDREYIAVYGSLMRIHGAQKLAGTTDKLEFIRGCRIPGRLYDLGEFPGLLPETGEVTGELFAVKHPDALRLLDDYEAFYPNDPQRSLFVRQEMRLLEPPLSCWVYLYNHAAGTHPLVEGGNWTEYLRQHNRPIEVVP